MSNILLKNRIIKNIDKLINQGNNFFIINGDSIDDKFFWDFNTGVLSLSDTLKKYLKASIEIKDILHYDDIALIEQPEPSKPKTECPIFLKKNNSNEKNSLPDNQEQQNDTNQTDENPFTSIINNLKNLISYVKNDRSKKFAIILNNFDWLADFYKSDSDNTITIFRELKKIINENNLYIFLIQKNTIQFEKFNYPLDKDNVITIGKPDTEELYCTFLHQYFLKFKSKKIKDLKPMYDLMSNFSAKNFKVNQLQSILDMYITQKVDEINTDLFKTAVPQIIEEVVSENDVIINDDIKDKLKRYIDSFLDLENPDFSKGFLMTGPPGTGKTHIARWLANENKCYFMTPKLSDLKGQYIGQSSQMVKALFNEARSNSPTIIFIDEIDTVLPLRDSENSDSFTNDIVNEFLQSMDGAGTQKDRIFIIGATNRPATIDNGIKRRLSDIVNIDLPNKESREKIFLLKLDGIDINNKEKWFDQFLDRTEGFSGSDIYEFCKKLKQKNNTNVLDEIDFLKELKETEKRILDDLKNRMSGLEVKAYEKGIIKNFKMIIGNDPLKNELIKHSKYCTETDFLKRKEIQNLGINMKGILLHGEPGTGKSVITEAFAGEAHMHFIKVLSKDIVTYSIEMTNKNLSMIFDYAYKLSRITAGDEECKGVILFFDEFDSIAGTKIQHPQIRGNLLDLLTKFRNKADNLIIIAATNFYNELDEATKRAGRFDIHIEVKKLNINEAHLVVNQFIKNDLDKSFFDTSSFSINDYFKNDIHDISFADLEQLYKNYKINLYFEQKLK